MRATPSGTTTRTGGGARGAVSGRGRVHVAQAPCAGGGGAGAAAAGGGGRGRALREPVGRAFRTDGDLLLCVAGRESSGWRECDVQGTVSSSFLGGRCSWFGRCGCQEGGFFDFRYRDFVSLRGP